MHNQQRTDLKSSEYSECLTIVVANRYQYYLAKVFVLCIMFYVQATGVDLQVETNLSLISETFIEDILGLPIKHIDIYLHSAL